MKQSSLDVEGFKRYHKATRRAVFLDEMNRVVPWEALCALIEPVYPKAGARGGRRDVAAGDGDGVLGGDGSLRVEGVGLDAEAHGPLVDLLEVPEEPEHVAELVVRAGQPHPVPDPREGRRHSARHARGAPEPRHGGDRADLLARAGDGAGARPPRPHLRSGDRRCVPAARARLVRAAPDRPEAPRREYLTAGAERSFQARYRLSSGGASATGPGRRASKMHFDLFIHPSHAPPGESQGRAKRCRGGPRESLVVGLALLGEDPVPELLLVERRGPAVVPHLRVLGVLGLGARCLECLHHLA